MMDENAICTVCKERNFGTQLARRLTGDPSNQEILSLVQKASEEKISNEVLFGTLADDYGREKVSSALLEILSGSESVPTQPAQPAPPARPAPDQPAPVQPAPPAQPTQPQEQQQQPPAETQTQAETQATEDLEERMKHLCTVCVARALLGMLETLKDWLLGKDKEYVIALTKEFEKGEIKPEEVIKNLYVKVGAYAVDSFNRIFMDMNTVFEQARNLALIEKPELAQIVPSQVEEIRESKRA